MYISNIRTYIVNIARDESICNIHKYTKKGYVYFYQNILRFLEFRFNKKLKNLRFSKDLNKICILNVTSCRLKIRFVF